LICISLMTAIDKHLLLCWLSFVCCFEEMSILILGYFNGVICLFIIELLGPFIYSRYTSLIRYMICKYFLASCGFSFFLSFFFCFCSAGVWTQVWDTGAWT
jgi:hypothetical protein